MIKHIKFLAQFLEEYGRNYGNYFIFQLCNKLKYERFKKGQVVFAQNEASNNKLYVILSGRVIIQRNEDLDQIIAIRDNKSVEDLSPMLANLSLRGKFPDAKSAKAPNPLMYPLSRSDSIQKMLFKYSKLENEEEEESEEFDGDLFIDNTHYEGYEKHFGHRREVFSSFAATNQRKTLSFQNLEPINSGFNMLNSTLSILHPTNPDFKKSKMAPTSSSDEMNILTKWSMQLSKIIFKIIKKPFKILKSEIVSPNTLENLIKSFGKIIRIMEKGDAVGEKSLIENNPRSATVCTLTNCEFLILEKKDLKHAKDQFEGVLKRRTEFLMEALKLNQQTFSSKVKENMLYSFSVEKHKKGHIFTQQGKSDIRFYLIEEGEVVIEKTIIMKEIIKGHNEFGNNRSQTLTLCVSGRGNFIGEEILFTETNVYEYTTKVISNETSVLVVNKHIFLSKFPSEIRQVLVSSYKAKTINRNKQIDQILTQTENGKKQNTASDIFYSRGVNVFNLLQKSCYNSFDKNIKRAFQTENSDEKPQLARSNSNKSDQSKDGNNRAKYAKYYIGPRAKCKYIKNTISFPKKAKIFNLENADHQKLSIKPKKNNKKTQLNPLKKVCALNPYEDLASEKVVIRKGEANQPVIDVEMLLGYSEGFMRKTNGGKLVKKLDFGDQDEVRFRHFNPKELDHNYLRESHKNFNYLNNMKKVSIGDVSRLNNSDEGDGVFVNYSKSSQKNAVEKDRKTKKMNIDYDELSHMNSTYNFSTMKRSNYQERFKSFNKDIDKEEDNVNLEDHLKKTMQCLKIENNNQMKEKPLESLRLRMHESLDNYKSELRFPNNKMHDIRLVKKCREKKQRGKRAHLI